MSTSRIDLIRIKALEDAVLELRKAVSALQSDAQQAQQSRPQAATPGISRNQRRGEYA